MVMDRISTWLWKAGLDPKVWRGRLQRRAKGNTRPAPKGRGDDGKRLLRMAPKTIARPVRCLSRPLPLSGHAGTARVPSKIASPSALRRYPLDQWVSMNISSGSSFRRSLHTKTSMIFSSGASASTGYIASNS